MPHDAGRHRYGWLPLAVAALVVTHVAAEPAGASLVLVASVLAAVAFFCSPRPLVAIAAALVLLDLAAHQHVAYARRHAHVRADAWAAERVSAVERRAHDIASPLQALARRAAALPDARLALTGDAAARSRLFQTLDLWREASRDTYPEPPALAVHDLRETPVAWSGGAGSVFAPITTEGSSPRLTVAAGTVSTSLIASEPILAADGHVLGVAVTELPIAVRRNIKNEFLADFDLLARSEPLIEIRYGAQENAAALPSAPGEVVANGFVRGPDGARWAALRVTAPSIEADVARLEQGYGHAITALAMLLVALWLADRMGRRDCRLVHLVLAAVVARALLLALPLPVGTLGSPEADHSAAGRLVGSPLDLLLSAACVALVCAWAARGAVRHRARLHVATAPAVDLLSLAVTSGTFLWIADVVFQSTVEVEEVSLIPRGWVDSTLQLSLLLITCSGAMLVFALQVVTRPPRSPLGRLLRLGLWVLIASGAFVLWPRDRFGLPLVPALCLFFIPALLAASWERSRVAWHRCGAGTRAGLLLAALVLAQLILHASLFHFAEKGMRHMIEGEYAALVLRQPQEQEDLLVDAQRTVDGMHLLEDLPPGSDHGGLTELAFSVWVKTKLATHGFSSAVEIQDETGAIVSRFALNLPLFSTAPLSLPPDVRWRTEAETLPLVSTERRARHAQRRLVYGERPHGAVHLYVADDFWNLPFLEARDPYPTLFRSATPRGLAGRAVHLVVYDANRSIAFSSADRPPGLPEDLARRLDTSPAGLWSTMSFGRVPHHIYLFRDGARTMGLSFPRSGGTRYAANLVEAAAGTALLAALVLLLLLATRSLMGRPTQSLHTVIAAVRTRFALRLFVTFVALAIAAVAILQIVMRSYLVERLNLSTERQGLQRAEVAQKAVEDYAYFQRSESPGHAPVIDSALVWVASLIRNDLDLFEGAALTASSKRELYASGLLDERVSGPVYRALVLEGEPSTILTERIGGFSYLVASVPVRIGRKEPAILSIPLALRQREVRAIVDEIDRTIRLASLLLLAGAALLAYRVARHISDPIRALTEATRKIAAGDLHTRVQVAAHDELWQLVEAFNLMALDLDRQRRALERSNRLAAWAEMARQVAHEVKNPLTPIQLSAQHLRRVFAAGTANFAATLETCTTTILEQVRKLREIATEFSAFARPPAAELQDASLPGIVREVLGPYEAVLPAAVRLTVAVEGEVPQVRVDRRLFDRALVNLLENALQAVGDSGRVSVVVRAREGRVEVEVGDSGPGIDPAVMEHVFEPFFSTKTSGSGLGLALTKKILEDHGGGVGLTSSPGLGTQVTAWLPVGGGEPAHPPTEAGPPTDKARMS